MLTDRVALITGATGGIGPAVVQEMAGSAVRVVAAARHEDALSGLARPAAIPAERWLAQAVDLTSTAGAEALVQATMARLRQAGYFDRRGRWLAWRQNRRRDGLGDPGLALADEPGHGF